MSSILGQAKLGKFAYLTLVVTYLILVVTSNVCSFPPDLNCTSMVSMGLVRALVPKLLFYIFASSNNLLGEESKFTRSSSVISSSITFMSAALGSVVPLALSTLE